MNLHGGGVGGNGRVDVLHQFAIPDADGASPLGVFLALGADGAPRTRSARWQAGSTTRQDEVIRGQVGVVVADPIFHPVLALEQE